MAIAGRTLVVGADELQQISACMLGASDPASLAHVAVLDMEMGLMRQGWPVGQSLGALPEVRKRLGLGRPAFREAITILEARGLLDVRRGPGGGLFVAAPAIEDVVGAILMYLALSNANIDSVREFRLLVWRMVVMAAIERHVVPTIDCDPSQESDLCVHLAQQTGNTTMVLLAKLTALLVRTVGGLSLPTGDAALGAAIRQSDLEAALTRLDLLNALPDEGASVISLELAESAFSISGRKSAMALAARMTREISCRGNAQEAEWETAERLGYTDSVVRQARRILQDFGIVRCRQGRKGAELAPTTAPTGVIRLLAPLLMASAMSTLDNREAISLMLSGAPALAASRNLGGGRLGGLGIETTPSRDAFEAVTLENLLLELSGNSLLSIVVRSLGVASIHRAADPMPPVDRRDVMAINHRILHAIYSGDVGQANVLALEKLKVMRRPAEASFRAVA